MKKYNKTDEKRTAKIMISVVIAVIMISSVLAIMFSGYAPEKQKLTYGGFTFEQQTSQGMIYYTTDVNKVKIRIQSYPSDLSTIDLDNETGMIIRDAQVFYISRPVNSPFPDYIALSSFDLEESFRSLNRYISQGLSDTNKGYENLPIITCLNATQSVPVILYVDTNDTARISREGTCIKLEASNGMDFIRLKDRIVLKAAGIM
jgi:hypothetical protein